MARCYVPNHLWNDLLNDFSPCFLQPVATFLLLRAEINLLDKTTKMSSSFWNNMIAKLLFRSAVFLTFALHTNRNVHPIFTSIIAIYDSFSFPEFSASCSIFFFGEIFYVRRLLNEKPQVSASPVLMRNSIYVNIEWQICEADVHKRLFMNIFHGFLIELRWKIDRPVSLWQWIERKRKMQFPESIKCNFYSITDNFLCSAWIAM